MANGFLSFLFSRGLACGASFNLSQAVTGAADEIEGVELFQIANTRERFGAKRRLAIEGVEHDPFQQVAQRHIVIFGEGLENFEEALLHANTGLNALDEEFR